MAITTTYSWQFVQTIDLDFATNSADVTGLGNGGFAGLGDHSGHIDGTILDSSGARTDGWTSTAGSNGALDQLSNGNVVVASHDADSTLFKIVDSVTGDTVVDTTDLGDADQTQADVAALVDGGFWIAATDEIGAAGGDADIDVFRRNDNGSVAGFFTIDTSVARDTGASIATLDDGGGVAIAWTRSIGAETEVWYAVYDEVGGVVRTAGLLDTIGTINRNVSVSAMKGGGFAIAYEDNGWTGTNVDITLARFDASGLFLDWDNVSEFNADDANPYLTRISNGMLAVAFGNNSFADTDTLVRLIKPNDGTVAATRYVSGGESIADDTDFAAIAGFGQGRLAAFHANLTDSDIDGEDLQAVRTTTGDGANDVYFGDELVDIVKGNGGEDNLAGGDNDDTVNGGDGDDILRGNDGADAVNGGGGADRVSGGAGADTMSGGDGNDSYTVEDMGDTIVEVLNQGIDTVTSAVTYALSAEVENLKLFGAAAFDGTGNGSLNSIDGNALANTLHGLANDDKLWGASGADNLYGDMGGDKFYFKSLTDSGTGSGNRDVVRDFTAGDQIAVHVLDANTTLGGDQAFVLNAGGGVATGEIGQSLIGATYVLLSFNNDADAAIDMEVLLANRSTFLVAGDFVL